MEKERVLKKENGITLIALIITIVVMLILAGVTINLTLGENGIFTTAQKAAKNYTESQNKELAGIDSFTNIVDKTVSSIAKNHEIAGTILRTENGINYTADGAGNTIPVPVGFSPITTKDQGTIDTGFVIKNNTDGNEFVWVPVKGMSYTYNRYSMLDWQTENGLDSASQSMKIKCSTNDNQYFYETLPADERDSVNEYGGYYIGRYEAGKENNKLVVQKGKNVWNNITRDNAVIVAKSLYNKENNNVLSKLCSSYAWDTALKFIETTGSTYPINSVGGNYGGSLKMTGNDTIHPCNIYDMGGNTWEWTTEYCNNPSIPCVTRGGSYNYSASENPAAVRSYTDTTFAIVDFSFRVTLYL